LPALAYFLLPRPKPEPATVEDERKLAVQAL